MSVTYASFNQSQTYCSMISGGRSFARPSLHGLFPSFPSACPRRFHSPSEAECRDRKFSGAGLASRSAWRGQLPGGLEAMDRSVVVVQGTGHQGGERVHLIHMYEGSPALPVGEVCLISQMGIVGLAEQSRCRIRGGCGTTRGVGVAV